MLPFVAELFDLVKFICMGFGVNNLACTRKLVLLLVGSNNNPSGVKSGLVMY